MRKCFKVSLSIASNAIRWIRGRCIGITKGTLYLIILFALREVIVLDLCTMVALMPGVGLCLPSGLV